jgi:hypothetical protein
MHLHREPLSLLPSALVLRDLCAGHDISAEALERAGFSPGQLDRYLRRCRAGFAREDAPGAAARGPAA